jgi:hypothetical protein
MGGSSSSRQFSSARGSTEMINDGCSYANRKVLIKGVGENLLPPAQSWELWRPRPPVAAPGTGDRHIDLLATSFQVRPRLRSSRIRCVEAE